MPRCEFKPLERRAASRDAFKPDLLVTLREIREGAGNARRMRAVPPTDRDRESARALIQAVMEHLVKGARERLGGEKTQIRWDDGAEEEVGEDEEEVSQDEVEVG
jgi:hypothetical protein